MNFVQFCTVLNLIKIAFWFWSSVTHQQGTLCQHCSVTRGAENYPRQKVVAAKEVLISQMALRLESVHIWKWAQIGSLPKHKNYILLASCLKNQRAGASPFLPPTAWERGGAGMASVTFKFCRGITQLSPALFQLGQEPLNHKHFHAKHTPVLAGPLHPSSPGCPIHLIPHSSLRTPGLGFAFLWSLGSFSFSQISIWM